MVKLSILKDFSRTPGPRYESEGNNSGEKFRKTLLLPRLNQAIDLQTKLEIDLDGTSGYGTSFLEEAFGGLVRINGFNSQVLHDKLILISREDETYIEEIWEYINDASSDSK